MGLFYYCTESEVCVFPFSAFHLFSFFPNLVSKLNKILSFIFLLTLSVLFFSSYMCGDLQFFLLLTCNCFYFIFLQRELEKLSAFHL